MKSVALVALRTVLSFWLGAAVLFVATSIREITSPRISEASREVLPAVRFPLYYGFGISCVLLALGLTVYLLRTRVWGQIRNGTMIALVSILALVTLADYFWVYRGLLDLMQSGQLDGPRFELYHQLSMWVNALALGICAAAAALANWPVRSDRR